MFGPDGMLYIGMGDGGSGGDPENRAQHPTRCSANCCGSTWITAIRTPSPQQSVRNERRCPGDLGLRSAKSVALRVRSLGRPLVHRGRGAGAWEEVDVQPASQGGLNFGCGLWKARTVTTQPLQFSWTRAAAVEYDHSNGQCAVIADSCTVAPGFLRSPASTSTPICVRDGCGASRTRRRGDGQTSWTLEPSPGSPLSFGEDSRGELYVLSSGGPYTGSSNSVQTFPYLAASQRQPTVEVAMQTRIRSLALAALATALVAAPAPALAALPGFRSSCPQTRTTGRRAPRSSWSTPFSWHGDGFIVTGTARGW